eukprot:SAG11_NODE_300_length_11057_cov_5.223469_9_plen_228_part_00
MSPWGNPSTLGGVRLYSAAACTQPRDLGSVALPLEFGVRRKLPLVSLRTVLRNNDLEVSVLEAVLEAVFEELVGRFPTDRCRCDGEPMMVALWRFCVRGVTAHSFASRCARFAAACTQTHDKWSKDAKLCDCLATAALPAVQQVIQAGDPQDVRVKSFRAHFLLTMCLQLVRRAMNSSVCSKRRPALGQLNSQQLHARFAVRAQTPIITMANHQLPVQSLTLEQVPN